MTEEKAKRLIVAGTVGAVVLVVVLLMVMVYQLISIGVKRNKINELEERIAEYNRLIESGEDTIKVRSEARWIEREARELGYIFKDDIIHN